MKKRTRITIAFIIVLSVVLVVLGMYSLGEYGDSRGEETRTMILQQALQKADAITDDYDAAAAYKRLSPALPEIQLRIVQRQWRIALEQMQYMQRAGVNVELQSETASYAARLKTLLEEIIARCGSTLADAGSLRPAIAWQLYNTAGSAKILSAFLMLETGQNVDKVQSVMRDALTDYKAAIEAVDKAGESTAQKNIPRWNFEMLNGEGNVQKFEVSMTDTEKNQTLKENLETLIPEIGGYGPGEPIETIIKK